MTNEITIADKLKLERMLAEVKKVNKDTLKIAEETQTMILEIEDSIPNHELDKLRLLLSKSNVKLSTKRLPLSILNADLSTKPASNIISKLRNLVKWIFRK